MKQLKAWAPWLVLAVVIVATGWYVRSLRNELRTLRTEVHAQPAPTDPAPQAPSKPDDAPGPWALSDAERAAMLFQLGGGDGTSTENPIWFVTDTRNVEAVAMQRSLRRVFEEAGWQVRGNVPASFPLKPGIFFLTADEQPPAFVDTALGAFEAAGLPVTAGRGYRAFYTEMKGKNPKWQGFDMAADQAYVVVVGRRPDPNAAPAPAPEALPE